jgi:murein tripeptide amidase MpaA
MIENRVTYIIRELVENYAAHPQYIDDVDWIFMPLVNPDGYEFAHTEVIPPTSINIP